MKEDAETVLEIMSLRAYAEAKRKVEAPNADEDNTTEWQRAVVFEVIEEIKPKRA